VIRIRSQTTAAEEKQLLAAFKKSPAKDGPAMLRTMSKGLITIEGQPGRKIEAVFSRQGSAGHRLIIIAQHVLSQLEKERGAKVEDFPLAVLHIQFDPYGHPQGGEFFPAAKLSVVDDFVDVQTQNSNKVTLINIARR